MSYTYSRTTWVDGTTGVSAARMNNLEVAVSTMAGSINRAATFTVAANNSSTADKNAADYLCDGTADQTEINQAITAANALGGGIVQLCSGTFNVSGSILMKPLVTFVGVGRNTQISVTNGVNTNLDVIKSANEGAACNHTRIYNLYIFGNKTNQTSGTMNGIQMTYWTNTRIRDVFIYLMKGAGIQENTNSSNNYVDSCEVYNCDGAGVDLESCGANNWITNNYCASNNYGIYVKTVDQCHVLGNQCPSNANHGILTWSVTNSIINNNSATLNTLNGYYFYSSGNLEVVGNQSFSNAQAGIAFVTVIDSNLSFNRVYGNSTSSNAGYDNIVLGTSSNYNCIQGNLVRAGAAGNKPAYGIDVLGTCTGNMVTNNDLHLGGTTGAFNDSGTSTVTTAANRTT